MTFHSPQFALLALLLLPSLGVADETVKLEYSNPLWDGYLADPQVFKSGDTYYVIGTGLEEEGRRFPMLRSKNFTDWEPIGGALEPLKDPQINLYWAPEIVERDGKFYLYYAANVKMRVAVSDKPEGPYKDVGKELFPELGFSIDGHAFKDPQSDDWYLFFAKDFFDKRPGTALAVTKLADDMITPLGPQTTVLRAFADWQVYERNRQLYDQTFDAWHTVEGPFVIFRDGRYHCFYSGGNWTTPGYGVGCAVSDSVLGPYVDASSPEEAGVIKTIPGKLIGPGHNSVILGPDGQTWFNFYHSWNPERTKRQVCMDPLTWTDHGPTTYQPSRGPKQVTLPLAP